MHRKPDESQQSVHPGPIDNQEKLCINDEEGELRERQYQNRNGMSYNQQDLGRKIYLKGTGRGEQNETECLDMFLRSDIREKVDYKVINEEMWNFLYSKYGGSTIKRYSYLSGTYYSQVEVRLKNIQLMLLPVDKLTAGGEQLKDLESTYVV